MPEPSDSAGLLLCDDLMFTSRVTGTARDLGFRIRTVRSANELKERATSNGARCVILDLGLPGLDVSDLLICLRQECIPMPFIVGYGSHVDAATLHAARAAGCDVVLPRSKFVTELPTELARWLASTRPGGEP